MLSFNRDARGFILKSSEFWIKIIYAVAKPVLPLTLFHYAISMKLKERDEYTLPIGYAIETATIVAEPLPMTCVGGMDAIPRMRYKWKAVLMGVVALLYTKATIEKQFFEPQNLDMVIHIESTGSAISFQALLINTNGVLALFLWKQAIDVMRNRDRCISITYRPYLEWVNAFSVSTPNHLKNNKISEIDGDGREPDEVEPTSAKDVDSDSECRLEQVVCCS